MQINKVGNNDNDNDYIDSNGESESDHISVSSRSNSGSTSDNSESSRVLLGDIIEVILAPSNTKSQYLVDYIDDTQIELLERNGNRIVRKIVRNNERTEIDGGRDIRIFARNPQRGYARQHGLEVNTTIAIHVEHNGAPFVVNGLIVAEENDVIELWLSSKDTLFVNFAYKGLPKQPIHITKIDVLPQNEAQIRRIPRLTSPDSTSVSGSDDDDSDYTSDGDDDAPRPRPTHNEEASADGLLYGSDDNLNRSDGADGANGMVVADNGNNGDDWNEMASASPILNRPILNRPPDGSTRTPDATPTLATARVLTPSGAVTRPPNESTLRGAPIALVGAEIGDVATIQYLVGVNERNIRYDLDTQTTDLLQALISAIPEHKRTPYALNEAQESLRRFIELHNMTSKFNANGNVDGFIQPSFDDRPLADYLAQVNNQLPWVVYVTKTKTKIRYIPDPESDNAIDNFGVVDVGSEYHPGDSDGVASDITMIRDVFETVDIKKMFDNYRADTSANISQNKYRTLYQSLTPSMTPFTSPDTDDYQSMTGLFQGVVAGRTNAVVDNTGDFHSTRRAFSKLSNTRFATAQYTSAWTYMDTAINVDAVTGVGIGNDGAENVNRRNLQKQRGRNAIAVRRPVARNDEIFIDSVIMLPESAMQYSRIGLPETDIMTRAQLGRHSINSWQLLNETTTCRTLPVNDDMDAVQFEPRAGGVSSFLQYITHFPAPNAGNRPPSGSADNNDPSLVRYLRSVTPSIHKLIHYTSKYMADAGQGQLSVYAFIRQLEPFQIYGSDITFKQYVTMKYLLGQERKQLATRTEMTRRLLGKLGYTRGNVAQTKNKLVDQYSHFAQATRELVYDGYNLPNSTTPGIGMLQRTRTPGAGSGSGAGAYPLTASELLTYIMNMDMGRLWVAFFLIIADTPTDIRVTQDIQSDMLAMQEEYNQAKQDPKDCAARNVTKRYANIADLTADNDLPGRPPGSVMVDAEYDNTDYTVLTKYAAEQSKMSVGEFMAFLRTKLNANTELATTLIRGAKKVEPGDYAIFINGTDAPVYYVRTLLASGTDNSTSNSNPSAPLYTWELDPDQQQQSHMNLPCDAKSLHCRDMQLDPAGERTCLPLKVMEQRIGVQLLENLQKENDHANTHSNGDRVDSDISDSNVASRTPKLDLEFVWSYAVHVIQSQRHRKYATSPESMQYYIGRRAADEIAAIRNVESPYTALRYLITSQEDFSKKQHDILVFCAQYARKSKYGEIPMSVINGIELSANALNPINVDTLEKGANGNVEASAGIHTETPWWLYCKQTGAPLIPTFYFILASAYASGGAASYMAALSPLIKEIGRKDANDDHWVDRYSGEQLSLIEFEQEDEWRGSGGGDGGGGGGGGDGGAMDAVPINDGNAPALALAATTAYVGSKYARGITNIVRALGASMYVPVDGLMGFIDAAVAECMENPDIIVSKDVYTKLKAAAKKQDKKIMSYNGLINMTFMYLTLGAYAIAVQTEIPSLRPHKSFPACVRSFRGYPTTSADPMGDITGITYVACAASHFNHEHDPWSALKGGKMPKIIEQMRIHIQFLLELPDVSARIRTKQTFLLTNEEDDHIPAELHVSKWVHFMPPQIPIEMAPLQPLSESFLANIRTKISHGNAKQHHELLAIQSKILAYSMVIQLGIQEVLQTKHALLVAQQKAYFSNACCSVFGHESKTDTTLDYFIRDRPSIDSANKMTAVLSLFLRQVHRLGQTTLVSRINTKPPFARTNTNITSETIYRTFIQWCEQLNVDTADGSMTVYTGPRISTVQCARLAVLPSFSQKRAYLDQEGVQFTESDFIQLLQWVGRQPHNAIPIRHLLQRTRTCTDALASCISHSSASIPPAIKDALHKVLNNQGQGQGRDRGRVAVDALETLIAREVNTKKEMVQTFLQKHLRGQANRAAVQFIRTGMNIYNSATETATANDTIASDIGVGVGVGVGVDGANGINNNNNNNADVINASKQETMIMAFQTQLQRMRQFIHLCGSVYPSAIKNQHKYSQYCPAYWGLSPYHVVDIRNIISNQAHMSDFYGMDLSSVMSRVRNQCQVFIRLADSVRLQLTPAFDMDLVALIMEYCCISVFYIYMIESTTANRTQTTQKNKDKDNDDDDGDDDDDDDDEEEDEFNGAYNTGQNRGASFANIVSVFIQLQNKWEMRVNIKDMALSNVLFEYKEAEKATFTDRLEKMSEDERQSEAPMQKFKLGRWRVGEEKGFRTYDPTGYVARRTTADQVSSAVDTVDQYDQLYEARMDAEEDEERYRSGVYGDNDDGDGDDGEGNSMNDDEYGVDYED